MPECFALDRRRFEMPHHQASFFLRYGCAVVSVVLAIGARLLLDPILDKHFLFATVLGAVFVTAYYGGFRPALVAVVLGAFAISFFLLPTRWSFVLTELDDQVGMVLYVAMGLGIALLAESLHSAQRALRAANDALETRVAERTRNLAEANEKLRASEERSRLIVQGVSSHAIFTLDPAGMIVTWNPGAVRITGYTEQEIVGQHYSRLHTAEEISRNEPQRDLQLALENGVFEEEGWRVRQDGSTFWAMATITPIYDHARQHIGFVKVTRDITKRKELAEALAEAARFNRATLDGLSAHIAILDEDGCIVAVNEPWEKFGVANGLTVGHGMVGDNYLKPTFPIWLEPGTDPALNLSPF